ncbi:tetratricopeptide repeat protein [Patescibacteria group bacterium]|nr:tetratricopeptide repeat protein [Patescibacteria group bacterium]
MKNKKEKNLISLENNDSEIKTFSDLLRFAGSNKVILFVISIFTLLIYANIVTGEFVNLDDYSKMLEQTYYHNILSPVKALDGFGITIAIFYKIFGVNSSAYHVQSILHHILNGALVFLLLRILFGKKISVISTFLFLAHPANTESISWHAGYPYIIRANIIIPILIFFALYKKSLKKKYLLTSALLYAIGLIFFRSGGWLLVAPFLVVIMDQFIIEEKIKFKNIKEYLPYLITSLIFLATVIPSFFKERIESLETLYYIDTETATPLLNRIPYTIYMQYKTTFYPRTLSIYHEGKFINPTEYTFMVFVTMLVIFGIFYFWKKDRRVSGLMLMMIFSILPSFSPVIIAWIAAERYQYIPSIFSSVIIIIGLIWVDKKLSGNNGNKKYVKTSSKSNFVLYSSIIIILLYSIRTVFRNNDLRNSKNLWIATKKTAPYSYRVYNNMGDVLANEGDLDGALENFKRSVALKPDYADAVHNIGHIYMTKRDYERAEKYLLRSLEMNPRLYPSAFKLGIIYLEEGKPELAKQYFEMCLQYDPTSTDCVGGLKTVNQLILQTNN